MPDSSLFKFLTPSLMSEVEIKEELKRNFFKIKDVEKLSRSELTELYMKNAMPLPQRKLPDNNHGKPTQMIPRKDNFSSRNIFNEERKGNIQYGFGGEKRRSNSERIKPPINSSEVPNKKICLSKTCSPTSSLLSEVLSSSQSMGRSESNDLVTENVAKRAELKRKLDTAQKNDDAEPSAKVRQRIAWP